jgi:hypothetical protein
MQHGPRNASGIHQPQLSQKEVVIEHGREIADPFAARPPFRSAAVDTGGTYLAAGDIEDPYLAWPPSAALDIDDGCAVGGHGRLQVPASAWSFPERESQWPERGIVRGRPPRRARRTDRPGRVSLCSFRNGEPRRPAPPGRARANKSAGAGGDLFVPERGIASAGPPGVPERTDRPAPVSLCSFRNSGIAVAGPPGVPGRTDRPGRVSLCSFRNGDRGARRQRRVVSAARTGLHPPQQDLRRRAGTTGDDRVSPSLPGGPESRRLTSRRPEPIFVGLCTQFFAFRNHVRDFS